MGLHVHATHDLIQSQNGRLRQDRLDDPSNPQANLR